MHESERERESSVWQKGKEIKNKNKERKEKGQERGVWNFLSGPGIPKDDRLPLCGGAFLFLRYVSIGDSLVFLLPSQTRPPENSIRSNFLSLCPHLFKSSAQVNDA